MPAATASAPSSQLAQLKAYFEQIRDRFHLRHNQASKWLEQNQVSIDQMRTTSQQLLAAASLAGAVAMNRPVDVQVATQLKVIENEQHDSSLSQIKVDEHQAILDKMREYVALPPGHLDSQEELYLEQQLSDMLGFDVVAELDGHRLNHSIGIMGSEQHLMRFPGDTLEQHTAYREAGIAPNRGAFGWFTENGALTEQAIANEQYYFAVQTMYLPDWNTNHAQLKPWYKFRKMVVINPAENIAVVGVVGDAGPAKWVNKQFGGSPEIIREAKIWSKASKGRVILLFVDDPDNTIPLGPIDLNQTVQVLSTPEPTP